MIHLGIEGYLPFALYAGMWGAFLASVFWRPSVGMYVVVFALPMQTGRYRIHEFPLGSNFVDILLLGVALGLLRKGEKLIPASPVNKLLAALVIFYYLSLWQGSFFINAPIPISFSDPRVSDWKNYVELFLFAPLVAASIKDEKQVKWLLAVIGLSVLVVNRSYFGSLRDRDLSQFSYDVRDAGLLGYAGVNGFAAFEAMFMAFLLGMYFYVKPLWARVSILFLLATSGYCLLFSFSRGAYVGMLIALIVVGVLKSRMVLVTVLALVVAWQTILPSSVQERIMMTTEGAQSGEALESSSAGRVELWADALELVAANPVTGTGFETYEYLGRVKGFRDTHNYYVKILVETGIVGFLVFLWLIYRMAGLGFKLYRDSKEPFWSGIGLGFFALMCSAIVLNFFGDRWTYQQVNGFLWVLLGCVIRGHHAISNKEVGTEAPALREPSPAKSEMMLPSATI
jgi:O-antigen ligase